MSIGIVVDSASDLPDEVVRAAGIEIVPLKVRIDDQEYIDGVTLTRDEFWTKSAASSSLPQTSAPSPGEFEQRFRSLIDQGTTQIICVTLSSELSATYHNAILGAQRCQDARIAVLDSRTVSIAEGVIALEIAKRAAAGVEFDHLVSMANRFPNRSRTFGTLDTLENLKKGGRIGSAQALLGSLLSFKPVIEVANGVVQAESRQRTRVRSTNYLIDKVASFKPVTHVAVIHAMAPDAEEFARELKERCDLDDLLMATVGSIIGTHAGPRVLGVTFWTEDPLDDFNDEGRAR